MSRPQRIPLRGGFTLFDSLPQRDRARRTADRGGSEAARGTSQGGSRPPAGAARAGEPHAARGSAALAARRERRRVAGDPAAPCGAARRPPGAPGPGHHRYGHFGTAAGRTPAGADAAPVRTDRPAGGLALVPRPLATAARRPGRVGAVAEPDPGDPQVGRAHGPDQRQDVGTLAPPLVAGAGSDGEAARGLRSLPGAKQRRSGPPRLARRPAGARARQSEMHRAATAGRCGGARRARRGDRPPAGLARGQHPCRRGGGDPGSAPGSRRSAARAADDHRAPPSGAW